MPDEDFAETENEIIVTGKKLTADGGGGGGGFGGFDLWGGSGFSFGGGSFLEGCGRAAAPPPVDEHTEDSDAGNEIVVEADRPTDDDFSEPPLTYGDFVNDFFDFLDRRAAGEDRFEFRTFPVDVEYDLSVDVEGQTATATVYDRWNETQTVYSYSDNGNYFVFERPLDNTDFSREGQHSLRDIPLEYEYF